MRTKRTWMKLLERKSSVAFRLEEQNEHGRQSEENRPYHAEHRSHAGCNHPAKPFFPHWEKLETEEYRHSWICPRGDTNRAGITPTLRSLLKKNNNRLLLEQTQLPADAACGLVQMNDSGRPVSMPDRVLHFTRKSITFRMKCDNRPSPEV